MLNRMLPQRKSIAALILAVVTFFVILFYKRIQDKGSNAFE